MGHSGAVAAGGGLLLAPLLALALLVGVAVIDDEDDQAASGGDADLADGAVPSKYASLITQAAQQCESVTAPLLAAQLEQESGFRADVISGETVSSAGAIGIAQFMPSTWAAYGEDYSGDGTADVTNPADAIPSQATYMCQIASLLKPKVASGELSGDLTTLMLAAYNAGEYAVIAAGGVPSYPETQKYISIITSNIDKYEAASFQQPSAGDSNLGATDPSACTVDANLPRENPVGCAEAVSKARSLVDGQCSWYQMCLAFTAVAYGWAASGEYSAHSQYLLLRNMGQIRKTRNPPAGALVFWKGSGPYGHVALAVGNGQIASNDIRRSGCIDIVPWNAPETEWGQRYLGWSPPLFPHGV